ncbi:MAG: PEGA domain-containing protein, partial [Candidatus Aminicenantes bacterium]|nr:PEGA domain-containing protein [Candidatus Aminicenantes bacterium]
MHLRKFPSKRFAYISLFSFFLLLWSSSYAGAGSSVVQQAEEVYNQGIELYTAGEYLKAIQKFTQVLAVAGDEMLLIDTYFHLSLCNYYLGESASAKDWIQKVLESEPGREVSKVYPKSYRELFDQVKREYAAALEAKRREVQPVERKPETKQVEEPAVAVQAGMKRSGGGSKTLVYVLGGLVIVGGAVAAVLLLGGSKGDEAVSGGSIQVNSSPAGASVFLDGQDTGRVTNTTLTDVAAGSHTVSLRKDGYGDYETSVSVTDGATATVDASLTAHTITVTQPKAATNWTQGQDVEIRWNTGGGLSRGDFIALRGN